MKQPRQVMLVLALAGWLGLAGCAHTARTASHGTASTPPATASPPPSAPGGLAPSPGPSGAQSSLKESPAPRPPSSPSPPAAGQAVVITQADSGQSVALALGSSAELRLPTTLRWSAPVVGGHAVTLTAAPVAASLGYAQWTVKAVAAGSARISSGGAPICSPGMACPQFVEEFTVTVTVT
jgi:hypothetical protein